MNKNKHEHIYTEVVLNKVKADNIKYNSAKPMAILARKCECGQEQAFEYGELSDMEMQLAAASPNKEEL